MLNANMVTLRRAFHYFMIDYTNANIEHLSVHHIGNKTNYEELVLSKAEMKTGDARLRELLCRYFLSSFQVSEYYSFTFSNEDFTLNPLFQFATQIFNDESFHKASINIARHLFEISTHPQIKSGDLFVAYINDLVVDNETIDAIGIFKAENRQAFLQLSSSGNEFSLQYDDGINIERLDKGCLILGTEYDSGFKICIVDRANKSIEAQFWKDDFLMLKNRSDEFHHTRQFLNITKNYITKQYGEEFEIDKTDQIDLLNRSVEYFKTHDTFDKKDFEKEVFQHPETIRSFRKYDEQYREDNDIDIEDRFGISAQAVKKQERVFKSVLKLDKNFHVYIHGNKDLIERGVDRDGRKYYKIYYEEES